MEKKKETISAESQLDAVYLVRQSHHGDYEWFTVEHEDYASYCAYDVDLARETPEFFDEDQIVDEPNLIIHACMVAANLMAERSASENFEHAIHLKWREDCVDSSLQAYIAGGRRSWAIDTVGELADFAANRSQRVAREICNRQASVPQLSELMMAFGILAE